jgi:G3E family GTPase
LRAIESRLNSLNPLAPIIRAQRADVALDRLLGRRAFDLDRIVTLEPEFLQPQRAAHDDHVHGEHCDHCHGHEADHEHEHDHEHDHQHDAGIASISLQTDRPLDGERFSNWLNGLVASKGADILRSKGIIDVAGDERRLVFQSVHMLLEGDYQRPWKAGERRFSRMVFIGRHLDRDMLETGMQRCVA